VDKVVIDCGVAIKWLVGGASAEQARDIFNRYRVQALELLAPDFIRLELANVLWNLQRLTGLRPETARSALEEFLATEITYTSVEELLTDAYEIAVQHQRSVYDSLYLALSMREGCPVVTADEKLYNAVTRTISNVVLLANWT
jgi:predicted nucleic acid-binding protein